MINIVYILLNTIVQLEKSQSHHQFYRIVIIILFSLILFRRKTLGLFSQLPLFLSNLTGIKPEKRLKGSSLRIIHNVCTLTLSLLATSLKTNMTSLVLKFTSNVFKSDSSIRLMGVHVQHREVPKHLFQWYKSVSQAVLTYTYII